jgi:PAS domain S-box-containing protein
VSALDVELGHRDRAEKAQARLAAIVESSDDAIISKTLDGVISSWNSAAERLFGYTAAEMIGQPVSRLAPPDRRDDFTMILDSIRSGVRVDHFETERVRKDGHRLHVSLTVSPIRDANGRIIGASKIARDVTDRKRAEAERDELLRMAEQARALAEGANRAKDEFLAMLGHELRNPLAAVQSAISAALLDPSRRTQTLHIARRQAAQLGHLVDDLLDVARITEGKIVLRKERLRLAHVVERAVESIRTVIEERGHTLSVSVPSDPQVDVDAGRMEQVVVNLLTNAAKYTLPGGRIDVIAEPTGQEIVLRVRDPGIGISAEMLPRVFDPFSQADLSLDRAQRPRSRGRQVSTSTEMIRHVRDLNREGVALYAWSSGGGDYARQSAQELGIAECFKAFLPKPNVIIDDQAPAEWRRLVHVHPGEASSKGVFPQPLLYPALGQAGSVGARAERGVPARAHRAKGRLSAYRLPKGPEREGSGCGSPLQRCRVPAMGLAGLRQDELRRTHDLVRVAHRPV